MKRTSLPLALRNDKCVIIYGKMTDFFLEEEKSLENK